MNFLKTSPVSVRIQRLRFRPASRLLLVLAACWLGVGNPARAVEEELPKAEDILDQHVKATGGKEAYQKMHNRIIKGTMEMVGMGIKAPLTTYSAAPNKHYFLMESQSIGKFESGFDGEVAWEINTMQGPRIKKGEERALAVREGTFNSELHWRELYEKAECVGAETVNDKECYRVVMTPKEGAPETRYYDQESHLLVKVAMTVKTPMGEIPVEAFVSDYKEVDGVLFAHKTEQTMVGQKQALVIESIEHNVDLPADRFQLPEQVQALAKKQVVPESAEKAAENE